MRSTKQPRRAGQAGRGIRLALGAIALGAAVPAAAQFSESYKFLEAVRNKEGDKVTDALAVPGTTIINTRDASSGETALHIVTQRRDATWMSFLIGKGANVNARTARGITPLELAVSIGFAEGVDLLVSAGARVDEGDQTGETPLISAVHRRNMEMIKLLVKAGANPDRPDNSGRSARDYARMAPGASAILAELDSARTKGKAAPKYGPSL